MSYQQPYGFAAPPPQTQVLVQPYRCSTAHLVIAWVCAVLTAFYLLPWAVAATRNRNNVGVIALINLFLGWSIVGWVVALVMACGSDRPMVLVQTTYAPPALAYPPQQWGQVPPQPRWVQPSQPWQQAPQPWEQTSQPWDQTPQPWTQTPQAPPPPHQPSALPAAGPHASEPTVVDPMGSEPTRPLPRSPWEPHHRA